MRPSGSRIASGEKTLEIRRWHPHLDPSQDLLIIENGRFLHADGDEDAAGVAVAIVRVKAVRAFTPDDIPAACASYFEAGWLAWELSDIRPLSRPFTARAARGIYEVELMENSKYCMNTHIRVATPADINAIFDIRTSVTENHLSHEQLTDMGITPDAIEQAMQQVPCIWIAEVEGVAAGFSMADVDDGCVFAAFIRPEFEGLGLGRRLMEKAEALLFQHHQRIWLETAQASRAHGFYQRLGWQVVEPLPEGDVRMEKHLQSPHP